MDNLEDEELAFYKDQQGSRSFRLSEQVDDEYEKARSERREKEQADKLQQEKERTERREQEEEIEQSNTDYADPSEFHEVTSPTIPKRRGSRVKICEGETPPAKIMTPSQLDLVDASPQPVVRLGRNVDDRFKDAIATVSHRSALSVAKSRIAVQAVCEKIYQHRFFLSREEKEKYEPTLQTINEEEEPANKKPRTREDYQQYAKILPSARVVTQFKHDKSLHQEIKAASSLFSLERGSGTRVTLHYDTTSRSRIDGEWPALILNFLNDDPEKCGMFRLRALFFAFEDRNQITLLITETLKRLAVATGDESATAAKLWSNIYAVMTDAVTKNLKIEEEVAKALGSSHVPLHLLCKSHTCEKFDESCINSLVEIERELSYADLLIKRQPRLKPFIRQSKCVVVTAMKALLKLVSHEESAKPTSLAKEFDLQLEKDGVCKSLSLYKERRFSKMGYTAGAIVECIPQFKAILEETSNTNMLTEACKLYLESEYIIAAMRALANFTYRVTMPYLNCIERSNQNELVKLLPKLCVDLKEGKMDTMNPFHVPWTHVNMSLQEPTSPFDHHLLKMMCEHAAKGVEMQCAKEYWEDSDAPRATQLHKLKDDERKNIPTENLTAERYFSEFDRLATVSAAKRNRFFKANRIRDDMMFISSMDDQANRSSESTKRILKQLDEMEMTWSAQQRQEWRARVEHSMQKKARSMQYRDLLLSKCKEHQGPFVNSGEVKAFLTRCADDDKALKSSLRQEIGFQKCLHPVDARERHDLYRMNYMTSQQLAANLIVLLDRDVSSQGDALVCFPSEEEIMDAIQQAQSSEKTNERRYQTQQMVAVIWDNDNERYWCLGIYISADEDGIHKIDHLESVSGDAINWSRPRTDDVQNVKDMQILQVDVQGEWNFRKRTPTFVVGNREEINEIFQNL